MTNLLPGLPGGSDGKASVYNVRDLGSILSWEDSLEKEMAPHSSTLALKIPWMEELGAGHCPRGRKSRAQLSDFTFTFKQLWYGKYADL